MGIQTFRVTLREAEKEQLRSIIRSGTEQARTITRAHVLLLADEGKRDKEIYSVLHLSATTPYAIRKRYYTSGLTRALYELDRPGQPRKLSGEEGAEVVAIACTKAPKGSVRWTLDLLTGAVQNKLGVTIGRTAIWKVLLRNNTKPWRKKTWCIPSVTASFKKRMLDVLEVYSRHYDPQKPVVCVDEKLVQLIKDTRTPLPAKAGKPGKVDYEYKRNGICHLFVAVEPKGGKRRVRVTRRRTKRDFASFIKYLVRHVYKRAKKIVLVEDNLNTHNKQSLFETLGEEGKKIARKIEWHSTPK